MRELVGTRLNLERNGGGAVLDRQDRAGGEHFALRGREAQREIGVGTDGERSRIERTTPPFHWIFESASVVWSA